MEKRRLLMELLSNLVAFVVFFNVFFIFYAGISRAMNWWFLLLALPFYGLFVIRRLIKDTGISLLLHLVFIVIPLFIFSGVAMWTVFVFSVLSVIYSIFMLIKGEHLMKFSTAVISVLLIFIGFMAMNNVMNITGYLQGSTHVATISALIILISVILFVQMDNLHFDLSLIRKKVGGKTEKKVFDVNNMLVIGFSALVAIAAIIALFVPGGRIVAALWRPVVFLFNQIVRFVVFIAGILLPEIERMDPPDRDEDFGVGLDFFEDELEEDPPGELIFLIIGGFVLAGVFIGILAGVITIIKRYLEYRRSKLRDGSGRPHDDSFDNLKFSLKDLAAFFPRLTFAPKHPIRKAYYKKVSSHIKQGTMILPSYTPEVIADRIRHIEDIDELTDVYEGVRYGRDG